MFGPNDTICMHYMEPSTILLINHIESIQNRTARFIFKDYSRHTNISQLKTKAKLPLLSTRKQILRLTLLHNIYYKNSPLKLILLKPPRNIFPRLDHHHKICLQPCQTKLFQTSPLELTLTEWNKLPADIVSIENSVEFRSACEMYQKIDKCVFFCRAALYLNFVYYVYLICAFRIHTKQLLYLNRVKFPPQVCPARC